MGRGKRSYEEINCSGKVFSVLNELRKGGDGDGFELWSSNQKGKGVIHEELRLRT